MKNVELCQKNLIGSFFQTIFKEFSNNAILDVEAKFGYSKTDLRIGLEKVGFGEHYGYITIQLQ